MRKNCFAAACHCALALLAMALLSTHALLEASESVLAPADGADKTEKPAAQAGEAPAAKTESAPVKAAKDLSVEELEDPMADEDKDDVAPAKKTEKEGEKPSLQPGGVPDKPQWPRMPSGGWPPMKRPESSSDTRPEGPSAPGSERPSGARPEWPLPSGKDKTPAKDAETPVEKPDGPLTVDRTPGKAGKLRFQFRFQPWKDVLDWFARQADLSLVMDSPPSGTFNYTDEREYTAAEAIDLLNSVLLTKGYTLVRRGRMLLLVNLEDGIPRDFVSVVPLESLDAKGEFELVSVLFDLERIRPEEAEAEVRKLLGPQGSIVALAKSRQLQVTETAGRLRAIRSVLERIDGPEGTGSTQVEVITLRSARPEEVLPILRQIVDIPEDKTIATDGSIRIAPEAGTSRLLVSGRADKIARVKEVLKTIDVAAPGTEAAGPLANTPQLEIYAITGTDPAAAMAVLQTLLTGLPDVRMSLDPRTNNLIVLARPAQHATIKATLAQMQRDAQRLEVIRLVRVDPQTAVLAINRLFGSGDAKAGGAAPQVDADPTTRQLFIKGSDAQITQIQGLLEKMGESFGATATASSEKVRTLPLSGRAGRTALERAMEIWPDMRQNKIRVVSPSSAIPGIKPGSLDGPAEIPQELLERLREVQPAAQVPAVTSPAVTSPAVTSPAIESPVAPPATEAPERAPPVDAPPDNPAEPKPRTELPRSTVMLGGARIFLVAEPTPRSPLEGTTRASTPSSPIFVIPGPGGVVIASEDTEALDQFEQLLNSLSDNAIVGGREITIFYLKHAKASVVAETLDQVFGGGTVVPESSAEGSSPGGGAESGSLLGALGRLGVGRRIVATGALKITPDNRLNALVVQANVTDLESIEQLLKILDQKESPEDVLVAPKPRMIPVLHTQAEEIANVVKQVYADRMGEGGGRGGSAGPGGSGAPGGFAGFGGGQMGGIEQMMMMRRGGGQQGSSRGGGTRRTEEQARMTIGVDQRTNSLIVSAPDVLFEEVKGLVEQLDVGAADQNETVRVVTLHRASPEAVQQALAAFGGTSVQFSRSRSAAAMTPPGGMSQPSFGGPGSSSMGRGRSSRFGGMPSGQFGGMPSVQSDGGGGFSAPSSVPGAGGASGRSRRSGGGRSR